jgi:hypothetical protein
MVRRILALTFASLLAAGHGAAQTEVRRSGDKVDVRATAAAVSEVLDRLARETGMKVSYDGAPPRARISMSLSGATHAQAVLAVLEGQGLNYALQMDPTGTRVQTLLIVSSSGSAPAPAAPVARPNPGPRPIEREPDPEPEEEAPLEEPPVPEPRRPNFPFPGFPGAPTGPAVPLQLPTPPPVAPSPPGVQPQPQD